jgi:hypothetical protein
MSLSFLDGRVIRFMQDRAQILFAYTGRPRRLTTPASWFDVYILLDFLLFNWVRLHFTLVFNSLADTLSYAYVLGAADDAPVSFYVRKKVLVSRQWFVPYVLQNLIMWQVVIFKLGRIVGVTKQFLPMLSVPSWAWNFSPDYIVRCTTRVTLPCVAFFKDSYVMSCASHDLSRFYLANWELVWQKFMLAQFLLVLRTAERSALPQILRNGRVFR